MLKASKRFEQELSARDRHVNGKLYLSNPEKGLGRPFGRRIKLVVGQKNKDLSRSEVLK